MRGSRCTTTVLTLLLSSCFSGEIPPNGQQSKVKFLFANTLEAELQQAPLLVMFTAAQCDRCREFLDNNLPRIGNRLKGRVHVAAIDCGEPQNQGLCLQQFEITKIPTFARLDITSGINRFQGPYTGLDDHLTSFALQGQDKRTPPSTATNTDTNHNNDNDNIQEKDALPPHLKDEFDRIKREFEPVGLDFVQSVWHVLGEDKNELWLGNIRVLVAIATVLYVPIIGWVVARAFMPQWFVKLKGKRKDKSQQQTTETKASANKNQADGNDVGVLRRRNVQSWRDAGDAGALDNAGAGGDDDNGAVEDKIVGDDSGSDSDSDSDSGGEKNVLIIGADSSDDTDDDAVWDEGGVGVGVGASDNKKMN